MKQRCFLSAIFFLIVGCSRLETLTPGLLAQSEAKWKTQKPASYRLVVEMSGDRVETGRFEVIVQGDETLSLRRNGSALDPGQGQDYTMEGLFHMLQQELGLAEKPTTLGAPAGYTAYTMAQFDENTGRLIRYQRTVGGVSNSIEVRVVEFDSK